MINYYDKNALNKTTRKHKVALEIKQKIWPKFILCPKFRSSGQNFVFWPKFVFCPKFCFLAQILFLAKISYLWPKLRISGNNYEILKWSTWNRINNVPEYVVKNLGFFSIFFFSIFSQFFLSFRRKKKDRKKNLFWNSWPIQY